MVRRGWRDSLHLGNASAEAKAVHSVHLGKAAPAGPSKTSERAADRTEAVSLSNAAPFPALHCAILCQRLGKQVNCLHIHIVVSSAAMFMQVNPIPVKTAMHFLGYCKNEYRMPLCEMSDGENEKLRTVMREYGLKV